MKQILTSFLINSLLTFIVVTTFTLNSFSQNSSTIIFDNNQSEYFGTYNLITLHKSVYSFHDKYIPDTLLNEKTLLRKAIGFGYRIGKLFLLDFQEDFFIALIQHEVFGHGARYREFGHQNNSYYLSPFFPFGTGSGFAYSGDLKSGEIITPQESISKVFSGNEANLVLASTLSSQFILNDTIHYRQALLYLISQNNQLEYIWLTRLVKPIDPTFGAGGDIGTYIDNVNSFYGTESNKQYNINQISAQSLISLANPIQLYSLYTVLFQYVIKTKKHFHDIPMIKIGKVRYLPLFNYNLTPFGSEFQFSNIIRHNKRLFSFDVSLCDNMFNSFYGGTLKIFNIIENQKIGINLNCAIWNQPELELDNPLLKPTNNKTGGSMKIDINLRPVFLKSKLSLFIQAGYKTKGYLMGEPLKETFILRYGVSFHY